MSNPETEQSTETPSPQPPAQEPLPTAPDPALVNITEKGREPHQTRSDRET